MKAKALTTYYGGKSQALAGWLVSLMPPHRTYLEGCLGMGAVLLAKPVAPNETINDLNGGIVTLFQVVRDAPDMLLEKLSFTPYSREEYFICAETWQTETDPVEKARKVYVSLAQSFNGVIGDSWSCGGGTKENATQTYQNNLKNIRVVADRLKNVAIECMDVRDLLPRYDTPDTLVYLDPPYLHSTRDVEGRSKGKGRNRYLFEMTDQDHIALLKAVLSSKAMIMVSGYDNPLYNEMLKGFRKETKLVNSRIAAYRKNANPDIDPARIECVWISPNVGLNTLF